MQVPENLENGFVPFLGMTPVLDSIRPLPAVQDLMRKAGVR
jgi:hypothetical protein